MGAPVLLGFFLGIGKGSSLPGRWLCSRLQQLTTNTGSHNSLAGTPHWSRRLVLSCRSAGPLVLLRLLPSLVPEKFRSLLPTAAAGQPLPEVSEPQGEAFIAAASCLLPYLLSHRTRATAALAADTAATATDPASGHGADSTLADTREGGRAAKAANGEGAATGVSHLREAAAEDRRSQQQRQQQNGDRQRDGQEDEEGKGHGLDCGRGPGDDAGEEEGQGRTLSTGALLQPPSLPPRQLLVVLDTAIVAVMVAMPDSGALLRFVQLPNHVDVEEGEKVRGRGVGLGYDEVRGQLLVQGGLATWRRPFPTAAAQFASSSVLNG